MADYEAVIGLEVHAQLKTKSKLFCSCSTEFGQEPNTNVCPVCTGQPGSLPVLNARAVEYAVKMALAIGCTVNERSVFARKNYFYPDLPMGYQISQFDLPVAEHGRVDIEVDGELKTIGVTRIHMENDAGKSIHSHAENASFVDLNRAGTPLIEIVSDPDMRSPEEAVAYLKSLHSILLYLGICDGNMEEGSFRCDANVSIRPRGQKEFGTRAELKNMNSFRNVQRAIAYEITRQEDLLEDGEEVVQETRLFDADRGVTQTMRGKEEAHDYRYFPDPDLVPLVLDHDWIEGLRAGLPELPAARLARFMEQYDLPRSDAEALTGDRALADYYEAAVVAYAEPRKVGNWMMTEMLRMLNENGGTIAACGMAPAQFAALVRMVDEGAINQKVGKQVFADLFAEGGDPEAHVREKGLVQISDTSALEAAVDEVIAANPEEAEAFRGGKTKLMGFFVGQVMRRTKGQGNPKLINEILISKLS
ncbi:aspartyl-tRNA(Asn)/glutamyl-tRNA(Gln) amidotransferase subunit B [Desulfobaculum xiamenense]|uniref:Aspartyl/glutamyl-tRNA(Asn/Gln) amidotransferase subunit B n=1 Tax=Desulfobaculum xiamenense TaxID=995050 RepID=A0A846QIR5_9BACT|nr:Asp-tRNA(Asn)/Glu-tRNA(Gln) amidotransferase subunit GatB [Desulfobaculum xiamenense]NJB66970.1 aspartyl-tRNA(Asn)/glutamyl-tRNA(Gln) amidotransferase subunit B [Desulfobaculum xiamenense]